MKKIPIWKNIVLLISIVVVIVIATFAWFYTKPWAMVDEMTLRVGKATYVQVSGDKGENWSDDLDIEFGVNKNLKEISGNGSQFFAPTYDNIQLDDGSFATKIVKFSYMSESEKYFEQTLDFRSDAVEKLYLAPESSVTAVDEDGNSFIDGAIRVAFYEVDENGKETLSCIWAPNSKVQYSYDSNSLTREGRVEPYYYYQKSTTVVDPETLPDDAAKDHVQMISTAGTDANGCGYNKTNKFMWTNGENMPSNAPSILTMDTLGEEDFYYKRLKIRVWIEGYDRECVSLLSGERFTINLSFNAQKGE